MPTIRYHPAVSTTEPPSPEYPHGRIVTDPEHWAVEAEAADGGVEMTLFYGPGAEGRAKVYAGRRHPGM